MSINLDHAYDEYLKSHAADVVEAIPKFRKKLEKSYFRYGRFTIPTFFKPLLITPKQEHILKRVSATFSQAINIAIRLYFEESHLSHVFRVSPEAADLISIDPGYSSGVVFSRFNAILKGENLKVLEFNCDSPAGAAYTDEIEKLLFEEELPKAFSDQHHLKSYDRAKEILDSLLTVYEEFGGYETPTIAIMDWRTVRSKPEFEFLKEYFESKGYKAVIADPREFKYKGGSLYFKNSRIRLILRRAVFDELLESLDDVQDLIKAYRDKAVCMVNPLRSRLAGTKAFLSILTNPEYDHYFDDAANEAKREFIPWTRRLVNGEDFFGRKKVYLIDFLKDQKESLVLKPSRSYGGKDVIIGMEAPEDKWNETIDRALKGDWVMQEYVDVPSLTVPAVVNKKLDFEYKRYNYNILVFGGKYAGGFCRLSDEAVINVARGGGLIPSIAPDFSPDRFGAA